MKRDPSALELATIVLDFAPSGLLYDRAERALYIVDARAPRILRWSEGEGVRPFAMLSADVDPLRLGQRARWRDQTFLVPRHGSGEHGAILICGGDGAAELYGIDPTKKRIGIAVAPDGAIYSTYFRECHGPHTGALALIDQGGAEVDLLPGLDKPVGVVATDAHVFVSDQTRGEVLIIDRRTNAISTRIAIAAPDALCTASGSELFVCTAKGEVLRIREDGAIDALISGLERTRGIACDVEGERIFVAEALERGGRIHVAAAKI